MRLVLVRHGETEHNRARLTLGRADVPLNDLGRAQAAALGASFVRRPEAIYTSPLERARVTAEQVAGIWQMEPVIEERLIEMDVGEMEHLTPQELRERYPDFLRDWAAHAAPDARMPGGETLREVQERAWVAVIDMLQRHPAGEVVAVTHNFVILTLICRALALPLEQFRRVRQMLAAKTVIEVTAESTALIQLNDTGHLVHLGGDSP